MPSSGIATNLIQFVLMLGKYYSYFKLQSLRKMYYSNETILADVYNNTLKDPYNITEYTSFPECLGDTLFASSLVTFLLTMGVVASLIFGIVTVVAMCAGIEYIFT
jgi:hypothetical protein